MISSRPRPAASATGPKNSTVIIAFPALPVLHDGHLIGRVDAKTHRESGVLELKHVHVEPWFAAGEAAPAACWGTIDREAAIAGLAEAARSLAAHVGCTRVTVKRVTPGAMKAGVAEAIAQRT